MEELDTIQRLIIWIPPLLFAITLHEVAHGWVALGLGDSTAKRLGRLSLNPLRHVDPIGTVLIPAILFFSSGFIFGWAKPVPINFHQLRHPKRDMALVALAGPAANIGMALAWALMIIIGATLWAYGAPWLGMPLYYMGHAGIFINCVLAVLNLLPIPPLDGSRVLTGLLPNHLGEMLARVEPFGLVLLLLLLVSGMLVHILEPPVRLLQQTIYTLFGY